ncbi:hypothetical protein FQA39_LY00052 [Lamprigera yunnana]|nr:hypothetical protein FQA39_LY00052 [Lamprigera yunnana]
MNSETEDKNETRVYNELSVDWWNSNGNMKPLHQVHELVFPHIRGTLQKHGYVKEEGGKFCVPKECHLLDVGCGGGLLTEPLSEIGLDVVGIDINQKMIEVAKEHARLISSPKKLSYAWETIETHAQNYPEKYDVVIITFVLPHVKNHEILLRKAIETLKPGGLLYLTSAAKTFMSWMRISILYIYVYRYVLRNSHNWKNFISTKEVAEILYKIQLNFGNKQNNILRHHKTLLKMNSETEDKRETRAFNEYSVDWWNPNGFVKGLHQVRKLVLPNIRVALQKYGYVKEEGGKFCVAKECHLLDVGCGGGLFTEPLSEIGLDVVGIDINQKIIEVAKEHARLSSSPKKLSYVWETIETHAQNYPEKYDVVIITFVLQHVKNHEILLRKAIETLKPGGLLYLTSAAKTFMSWIRLNILGTYVFRYLPKNSHNWKNFISAEEVGKILCKNNCAVLEAKGLSYDFFTSNWNLWNDVNGGFYSMISLKNN